MKVHINFSCTDKKEAVDILAGIAHEAQWNSVYCKSIHDFNHGRVGSMAVVPDKGKQAPPFDYASIRDFKLPESKIEHVSLCRIKTDEDN